MGTTAAIAATTTPVISLDTKYCGRALNLAVGTAHATVCSNYYDIITPYHVIYKVIYTF